MEIFWKFTGFCLGSGLTPRATTREEKAILARFLDSEDGLGLRGTIEEGRFHEVRRRARLMQSKGRILSLSNLYER